MMAGEWLKFEANTPEKPEVFSITAAMGWDDPDLTVGKLLKVWRWFDQQTIDGNAPRVTLSLLDRISGVSGFAQAMCDVGWLVCGEAGISLPNFDRHNGKTAKDRCLTAKRVAKHKSNAGGNAAIVTAPLPREEKRREEPKIENPSSEQSPDGTGDDETPSAPKSEKPRKHHGTEDDHKAARWIFERVLKVDATAKEPNWNGWANDVRLMREIDGRTHPEICDMFAWANKDSFWCSNILSPGKLREKWGTLAARRQQPQTAPRAPAKPSAYQVAHLDHSSTDQAMRDSMERHGIDMPEVGEHIEF